nr:PREDICTED: NADPH oxidase 5 [Struthio camelus australis]
MDVFHLSPISVFNVHGFVLAFLFGSLGSRLSQCYVDGPYGTPTRRIFTSEHAVLIGAGIGITPFASILQSIMYRYRTRKQSYCDVFTPKTCQMKRRAKSSLTLRLQTCCKKLLVCSRSAECNGRRTSSSTAQSPLAVNTAQDRCEKPRVGAQSPPASGSREA